jgi:hypothetical protein
MVDRAVRCTFSLNMECWWAFQPIYMRKIIGLKIHVVPYGRLAFEETIIVWLDFEISSKSREVAGETRAKNIMGVRFL